MSRAKKIYTEFRRMLHPNYAPKPRWDYVWDRVDRMADEQGLDLEPFIEAQFRAIRPFPMPNSLLGPKALERYKQLMPDARQEAVNRFRYEVGHLETRMRFMSVRRILEEEPSTLSPLFRYCVAHRFGLQDLVRSTMKQPSSSCGPAGRAG